MVTAPCRVVIDAVVEAWTLKFQRVVTMQLQVAKSRWKHNPQTNIMPVVKWAQRYTRDRQFVASPCDKEFGFCLETLEAHSAVQMDILMGNAYQEVAAQTVNNNVLFERYVKLCFAAAALEKNPDFAHEMVKPMPAVNASVLLHLLTTVKTHKAQGKVEHRNVHAGTRWAFTGLAQWVTAQLMENLRCDHFLTGLQDFVFFKSNQKSKFHWDPSCIDWT